MLVEGPRVVDAGTTNTWRVLLDLRARSAVASGINIAADSGELRAGVGLYLEDGELTHIAPQRNADGNSDGRVSVADVVQIVRSVGNTSTAPSCLLADANGDGQENDADLAIVAGRLFGGGAEIVWQFGWQAPDSPGSVRFSAAAVGANCNGTNGGDGVRQTAWEVLVTPVRSGAVAGGMSSVVGARPQN